MTRVVAEDEALDEAVAAVARGEAIAIPTETVYGLAADAADGDAVARIFEAKGRPRFNPLIVHVADIEMAGRIAHFDAPARRLAESFWPGPLTLVLPRREDAAIHPLVTAGLDTVAIRMPRRFCRDLVAALGRPVAAPSANLSGRVSATTAAAVARDLGDRVALVVDGGPSEVGVESTIVATGPDGARLLRPGGLAADEIEAVLGARLQRAAAGATVAAPGMLESHYAPRAGLRLDARDVRTGEALLGFGPRRAAGEGNARAFLNLSPEGDPREAARNLFSHLAALDASGATMIAVEPVPEEGLGEAINDRLRRAAAPRVAA